MLVKVEYLGFYPLGSDMKLDNVSIMKSQWHLYNKVAFTYGKKRVVSPFFQQLFFVNSKESMVFFVAVEYGLGHYHIFKTGEKTNQKLSLKIK